MLSFVVKYEPSHRNAKRFQTSPTRTSILFPDLRVGPLATEFKDEEWFLSKAMWVLFLNTNPGFFFNSFVEDE